MRIPVFSVSNHITPASFLYIPPLIIPGGGPLMPGGPIGPPRPIGIPGGIPITHDISIHIHI
jgi:hypothetical protein